MRIALVFPKWTEKYGLTAKISGRTSVYPPLQLAYLAALAENLHHDAYIIDGQVENLSFDALVQKVVSLKPDIVGITATTPFFEQAGDLARELKRLLRNIAVCIGGYHINALKEKAFYPCFDYAFIGDAFLSWPKFLINYGGDVSKIRGILYRENDYEVKYAGDVIPLADLDSLPVPSRHLLYMENYRMGTSAGIKKFTSIILTVGCPFNCIFCSTNVMGKKVKYRDPKKALDEVESVINHFGIKHFVWLDDTFTLNRKYTIELCNEIINRKLDITFEAGTRADLVDEELVALMKQAGLLRISFGYESSDPHIRKIAKKTVPLVSYDKACKLTSAYKIDTRFSGIIGLPGETRETAKKTTHYLANNKHVKEIQYSIAVPYPGTELYEMAKRGDYGLKLLSKDFSGFTRYNTSAMQSNVLTIDDIIDIQNDAYISIYLKIWRWKTIISHMGFWGIFMTAIRILNKMKKGLKGR